MNFHPKEGLKERENRAVEGSVARIPGRVLHETDPVCRLPVAVVWQVWTKEVATSVFQAS